MKVEVECYYKNVKCKFGELLRIYQTLSEPPTVEWIIKEHIPIPKEDIESIEVFYKIRDAFVEFYPKAVPYTTKEVFEKYKENAEKRYLMLSVLCPENIALEMGDNMTLVDEQTLTKTQKQTIIKNAKGQKPKFVDSGDVEIVTRTYEDTYSLYKINKEIFSDSNLENDAYIVKCNCTSTGRVYYLFVDGTDPRCNKDVIEAIAWTLRNENGEPLTKEEYLLIESES